MSSAALDWIDDALGTLRERTQYRGLVDVETPQGPTVTVNGQSLVCFASNDYLGLSADPRVRAGAIAAIEAFGTGAGGSRLISGNSILHRRLERELAALKHTDDAIVFAAGYLTNLGTISALVQRGDVIFSDALNHASIIDGCRLSGAEIAVYPHCDVAALRRLLESKPARRRLIVTDGVFSMDGDIAPLPALVELADKFGCMLMVDEAHATGVLGPDGAGSVEHFGLSGRISIVIGTLSKALAASGGYVAGEVRLIDYLRNRARAFVFTTGLPPAAAGAALTAIEIVREEPRRRERLLDLARQLREGLRALGFTVLDGETAIVPVLIGDSEQTLQLASALRQRGIFAPAIRPPTVPQGASRIRLALMATHTEDHVRQALDAFAAVRCRAAMLSARGVFVTGTDTGVGKTTVTAAIAVAMQAAGRNVVPFKPVQTGCNGELIPDAVFVQALTGNTEPIEAVCPYRLREPAAPTVAAREEGAEINLDVITGAFERLASRYDTVLVEGAGGLLVEIVEGCSMADLAGRLDLSLVIAIRPGLGTLNHTGLTVEAARARGINVAGIVISGFPDEPSLVERTNPLELARLVNAPLLGVLPFDADLDTERGRAGDLPRYAAEWLSNDLGGRFDRGAFLDRLRNPKPRIRSR